MQSADPVYLKEKEKYTLLWNSIPEYREVSFADFLTPIFLSYFHTEIQPGQRVIDFGCGTGRSAPPLLSKDLQVDLVDFAPSCLDPAISFLVTLKQAFFWEACLWDLPADLPCSDWIICIDVLEHLPTKKVRTALQGMSKKMKKGGLCSISLRKDQFGAEIGDTLHLTIKPKKWWQEQISAFFFISEELMSNKGTVLYAIRPK